MPCQFDTNIEERSGSSKPNKGKPANILKIFNSSILTHLISTIYNFREQKANIISKKKVLFSLRLNYYKKTLAWFIINKL